MRRVQLLLALVTIPFLSGQQSAPPPQYGPQYGPQSVVQGDVQADDQDQPGQPVARLGIIEGDVSVRRGDSDDWVAAVLNAPLMPGDSIFVPPGGRAELQLDYANFVRLGGDTELRISNLDSGRNQVQLSRGLITYRTLRDTNVQSEISTPAVAVHPNRTAAVRVEITPDGTTRITVRRGDVEASTANGTERIREGNMMIVRGSADDPEFQVVYAPGRDGWDGFNDQRDGYLQRAQSNRYVSPDVFGAEDLDNYGRWSNDPAYGDVWTPNVSADWAPYRNGQWVWEDFYGWTWVDADPWGWAPFHYGSWYQRAGYGWTWFPGHRTGHYWWHPAMVGFFGYGGGAGFGVGFGNVGWIPLAPYERFHPWYGPRGWGRDRINVVHNTNVINVYRNAAFGGGTAVSAGDFQRGQFRNRIPVGRDQLTTVSLVRGAVPMTPTANNLRFTDRNASSFGSRGSFGNQRFFSRTAPGNPSFQRTPFAQQQATVRNSIGVAPTPSADVNRNRPAPSSGSTWRRFGEPNESGSRFVPPPASEPRDNTRGSSSGDWGRFGSPQGTNRPSEAPRRYAAPPPQVQRENPAPAPQQQQRPDYSRRAPDQNQNRPAYSGGGYDRPPSRSLQVAPPIVHQRDPGSSNSRSQSPPPSRSAPQQHGNGGGGHDNNSHSNNRR